MIELRKSNEARKVCSEHASRFKAASSLASWAQIESVLASHIASVVYAEAEGCIKTLIQERISESTNDSEVVEFGKVASNRLVRSIKIGELTGTLGHFGAHCKKYFNDSIESKQKSDWESLIDSRHNVAHESSESEALLTLTDIEGYCASIEEVLTLFNQSLHASTTFASSNHWTDPTQAN